MDNITSYRETRKEQGRVTKSTVPTCMSHASSGKGRVQYLQEKEEETGSLGTQTTFSPHPGYLDKDVNKRQGCYDNSKNGGAGNDNDHGGERNKEGAQEHEHSGWQSFINDVDVLGEAVDEASYRCGVKKRLRRVKFVDEQIKVQLPGCTNVPHC